MDKPFRTDGCSVVADLDMRACCIVHDWAYWQGGTWRDRAKADREFYRCIKRHSRYRFLAGIRWFGARIGGVGWLPFERWRWGYGWEYPLTKAPKDDTSPHSAEEQRPVFEQLLREAREQKAKAQVA